MRCEGSRKVMQEVTSGSAHLALTADHIRAVDLNPMCEICQSGRHISHTSEQIFDTLHMRSGCRLNLAWHGSSDEQIQDALWLQTEPVMAWQQW